MATHTKEEYATLLMAFLDSDKLAASIADKLDAAELDDLLTEIKRTSQQRLQWFCQRVLKEKTNRAKLALIEKFSMEQG